MESSKEKIVTETLSLIADFIAPIGPVIHTLQFPTTISDAIFEYKLKKLLKNQKPDLMEWLKTAWKFEHCQEEYAANVRKLICFLNAMNEDKLIDIYANLLHAYQLEFINQDEFFRLSWILTQVYSDDLFLLKDFKHKTKYSENKRLEILEPYGLIDKHHRRGYNSQTATKYLLTETGKKMLACGIDYENYNEYK